MNHNILQNYVLINAVAAWCTAQIIKTIIDFAVNRKLRVSRLWGDGGMPSCHSATVCALTISIGIMRGFASPLFALSAMFAIIVMHDAMNVRLEAGKHAKEINGIMEFLKDMFPEKHLTDIKELKEFLGHTPYQVIVGGLWGIVVAILGCYLEGAL